MYYKYTNFLLEKCENLLHIFPTKNNSVFDNIVSIYLTSWRLNNVVKLTMLWTTEPRLPFQNWILRIIPLNELLVFPLFYCSNIRTFITENGTPYYSCTHPNNNNAPVICIPGSLGAGDSRDITGPKCRDLTFDESRQCRGFNFQPKYQFMPYSYNKGETQPVHLHSLISSCFVA